MAKSQAVAARRVATWPRGVAIVPRHAPHAAARCCAPHASSHACFRAPYVVHARVPCVTREPADWDSPTSASGTRGHRFVPGAPRARCLPGGRARAREDTVHRSRCLPASMRGRKPVCVSTSSEALYCNTCTRKCRRHNPRSTVRCVRCVRACVRACAWGACRCIYARAHTPVNDSVGG